ncbi:MAG TPA: hypothetical protein PKM59_02485 [Thermodesulfobacteriota bacterium]|nr:hypothetical protein [Thermodesulfobacteriota bacterium]
MPSRVTGLEEAISNLRKDIEWIKGSTLKGLIRGAMIIRRSMDTVPPMIPTGDTGNLRASCYVITAQGDAAEAPPPQFKGKQAAEMAAQHEAFKSERKALLKSSNKAIVEIGFTAYYAIYVHENIEHHFRREGGGAKFLEEAIRRNHGAVIEMIKHEARKA